MRAAAAGVLWGEKKNLLLADVGQIGAFYSVGASSTQACFDAGRQAGHVKTIYLFIVSRSKVSIEEKMKKSIEVGSAHPPGLGRATPSAVERPKKSRTGLTGGLASWPLTGWKLTGW